jgi:hypothetical protein
MNGEPTVERGFSVLSIYVVRRNFFGRVGSLTRKQQRGGGRPLEGFNLNSIALCGCGVAFRQGVRPDL